MFRLGQADALALLDAIECGRVPYTLSAEVAISGTDEHFEPARAPQPTSATPGSAAKIEILRARLARGECLFHPADRQLAPQPGKDIRCDCTPLCEVAVA